MEPTMADLMVESLVAWTVAYSAGVMVSIRVAQMEMKMATKRVY